MESGCARFTNGVSSRRGPEPPDDAEMTLSLSFVGDGVVVFTHAAPLSDGLLLISPRAARAMRSILLMPSMNPSVLFGLEVGSFRNEFLARTSALSAEISSSPRVAFGPRLASGCGNVVFRSKIMLIMSNDAVICISC